ncbi:MAG: universal stress protein [Elusimicrobiota bacterium]
MKNKNKISKGYDNILLPLGHRDDVNKLTALAPLLLDKKESKIHLLHLMIEGKYSQLPREWRTGSKRVTASHHKMMRAGINSKPHMITAKSIETGIVNQVRENKCDLVVLGWGPKPKSSISGLVTNIMSNVACDVIVFKARGKPEKIETIIYPFVLTPKESRLRMISKIMENTKAELTFAHATGTSKQDKNSGREKLEKAEATARDIGIKSSTLLLQGADPVEKIAAASKNYDLMVIGPSRDWWLKRVIFGKKPDEIAAKSDCSILMHKNYKE